MAMPELEYVASVHWSDYRMRITQDQEIGLVKKKELQGKQARWKRRRGKKWERRVKKQDREWSTMRLRAFKDRSTVKQTYQQTVK